MHGPSTDVKLCPVVDRLRHPPQIKEPYSLILNPKPYVHTNTNTNINLKNCDKELA